MQMEPNIIIFLILLASSHAVDPSACQHTLKFMLINACGATKRENHHSPYQFSTMSKEEVEERYFQMVKANVIKGVEEEFDDADMQFVDSNYISGLRSIPSVLSRFKRSFMGILNMKTITDPIVHEQRGGFRFVGQLPPEERAPAPRALKTKCCREIYLCTLDDFKGFCD